MIQKKLTFWFIKYYLALHKKYEYIKKLIFKIIKNIIIVYYVTNTPSMKTTKKNITLNYYSGLFLDKYKTGRYYVKKYHESGHDIFGFSGELAEIKQHKSTNVTDYETTKRKQLLITNSKETINQDLIVFDNYYCNIKQFKNPITEVNTILNLMNIKCDEITVIEKRPFKKKIYDIDEITIQDLYYN